MRILYGVTGGVAAVLTMKIIEALQKAGHEVQVVTTERSSHFLTSSSLEMAELGVKVWTDADEWPHAHYEKGARVLHIDLREWADVMLIAPLTANTLAKIANGMADNLLTSIMRAWHLDRPVVIAPAMNTLMWTHPVTEAHLLTLELWYDDLYVVEPVVKKLACGDTGIGALADISQIVAAVNCFVK